MARETAINRRAAGSCADVSLPEVLTQLRAQSASMEELQRAVRELQDAAVLPEARVSGLGTQWQHQEQVGPAHTEYCQLTPRDAWYDDLSASAFLFQDHQDRGGATGQSAGVPEQSTTSPSRIDDLATYSSNRQAGGQAQSTEPLCNGGSSSISTFARSTNRTCRISGQWITSGRCSAEWL